MKIYEMIKNFLNNLFVTGYDSSGVTNNFDGSTLEVIKSGLEKTTSGSYDPDTDSNEALRDSADTGYTNVYNNVKLINTTAIDGSTPPVANTISDILHKDASYTYDNTTDSLEAITDTAISGYGDVYTNNVKYLMETAITGEAAYSIAEILKISATEKLKDFIAKTGGEPVPAGTSLYDAILAVTSKTWQPEDPQTDEVLLTTQNTWYNLFTAYSSTTYVVKGAVSIQFAASESYELKVTYANASRDNGPVTSYVIGASDLQRTIEILPTEYVLIEVRCTTAGSKSVTYDRCFEFAKNSTAIAPT